MLRLWKTQLANLNDCVVLDTENLHGLFDIDVPDGNIKINPGCQSRSDQFGMTFTVQFEFSQLIDKEELGTCVG